MVAHKKKAIWGLGLIAFFCVSNVNHSLFSKNSFCVPHVHFISLPESSTSMQFWDFSQISDFNLDHFNVFLDFFPHYFETESEKTQ